MGKEFVNLMRRKFGQRWESSSNFCSLVELG